MLLMFLTYIYSSEHKKCRTNAEVVDEAQDNSHGDKLQAIAPRQQAQNW